MILSSAIHLHPLDYSLENIRNLTNEELALAPFHPDIDDHDESTLLKVHRIWSNRREKFRLNSHEEGVDKDSLLSVELSFSLNDLSILTSEQLSVVQFHPDVTELIQLKAEKVWRSRREKDLLKGCVWEDKNSLKLKREVKIIEEELEVIDSNNVAVPPTIESVLKETAPVVEPLVELERLPLPHSPLASTSQLTLERLPPLINPVPLVITPTSNFPPVASIQDAPLPTPLSSPEKPVVSKTIRPISPDLTPIIIETSPIPEINRSISRSPMSASSSMSPPPILTIQSIKLPLKPLPRPLISLASSSTSPPPQPHNPPLLKPLSSVLPPVKVLPPKPAGKESLTNLQNQRIFSLKVSNLALQVVSNSAELFKIFPSHLKPDAYVLLSKRIEDRSREGYVGYSTFERRTEAFQVISLITLRGNWRIEVEYVSDDVPKWVWSELSSEFGNTVWKASIEAEELERVKAIEVEERLKLEIIRKAEEEIAQKEVEEEMELREIARQKEEEIFQKELAIQKEEEIAIAEIEKERQLRLRLEEEKVKRELSAAVKKIDRIPSPEPIEVMPRLFNDWTVDSAFIDTFFPLTCIFLVLPNLTMSSDGILKFPKETRMKNVVGGQQVAAPRLGYHFLFATKPAQLKAKELILQGGLGGTLVSVEIEDPASLSWKWGMLQHSSETVSYRLSKARKSFYYKSTAFNKLSLPTTFTLANIKPSSTFQDIEGQALPVHSYFPQNSSPALQSQRLPSPVLIIDSSSSSIKARDNGLTYDENTDELGRALPRGWRRVQSKSEPLTYFFVNDNVEVDGATWTNPLDVVESDEDEEMLIFDNTYNATSNNGSNKSLQSQTRNEKLFPKFVPSTIKTNNYDDEDEDEDELSIFSQSNHSPDSRFISLPTWNTSSLIPSFNSFASSSSASTTGAPSSSLLTRTLSQPLNPPPFVPTTTLADRLHITTTGGTIESLVDRIIGGGGSGSGSTSSTSSTTQGNNNTNLLPTPNSPSGSNPIGPRWATQAPNHRGGSNSNANFNSSNKVGGGVGSLTYKNDTRSNNNNNNKYTKQYSSNSNSNSNNGGGLGLGTRMRDGIGGKRPAVDTFDSGRNSKKSKGGRGGGNGGGRGGEGLLGRFQD